MEPERLAFLTVYREDLAALLAARRLLAASGFAHEGIDHPDASLVRVLIVLSIQTVETALKMFPESEPFRAARVFDDNVPNDRRVESLGNCLEHLGVAVDREVLSDYLAIKYYRNALQHASWKSPSQRDFVCERGFPEDPRLLTITHWRRIFETVDAMFRYLLETRPALTDALQSDDGLDERDLALYDHLIALNSDRPWYRDLPRPSQSRRTWLRTLEGLASGLNRLEATASAEAVDEMLAIASECVSGLEEGELADLGQLEGVLAALVVTYKRSGRPEALPGMPLAYCARAGAIEACPELEAFVVSARATAVPVERWGTIWKSGLPDHVVVEFVAVAFPAVDAAVVPSLQRALRLGRRINEGGNAAAAQALDVLLCSSPDRSSNPSNDVFAVAARWWQIDRFWHAVVEGLCSGSPASKSSYCDVVLGLTKFPALVAVNAQGGLLERLDGFGE